MDEVRKQFDSELDKFMHGGHPGGDYVQTPMDTLIRRKVAELIAIDGFIENPEAGLVYPLTVEPIDAEFINSRIKAFGKMKHFPVIESLVFRFNDPILKEDLHKHEIKSLTEATRRMAYAFFLAALNARADGDAHYATFAFSEGCLRLGFLLGLGESIVRKNKNKVNAARGGIAKSIKQYKEIHDELVKLMTSMKPDSGWRTKENVARTLSPIISKTSEKKEFQDEEHVYNIIKSALKKGRKNTRHIHELYETLLPKDPRLARRADSFDRYD